MLDVAARLGPADEGFVKIVLTRGVEGQDDPTGWAYAAASPDHTPARTNGIRIVLLDRGYRHDVAQTSPWLLAGAKTLSYAINRAAFREAARRDADDALFVSSDGYLLEGADLEPGDAHRQAHRHPADRPRHPGGHDAGGPVPLGRGRGLRDRRTSCSRPRTCSRPTRAWLVSSVRHAAPVREIDGQAFPVDRAVSDAMNEFLRAAPSSAALEPGPEAARMAPGLEIPGPFCSRIGGHRPASSRVGACSATAGVNPRGAEPAPALSACASGRKRPSTSRPPLPLLAGAGRPLRVSPHRL